MKNELTSIAAIAEMIENEIQPKPGDFNKIDIEDIVEKVRNSYSGLLFQYHMQNLNDGDRLIATSMTTRKQLKVSDDTNLIMLDGFQIIDLPRDAGLYQVIPSGAKCKFSGKPLMRSTPAAAYATQSRIPTPKRFYRIKSELHFPDGQYEHTETLDILFYGLYEDDNEQMNITRTLADLMYKEVRQHYAPSPEIQADVTPNKNPNP